jgi:thiamine biosynthesis lipoprotein
MHRVLIPVTLPAPPPCPSRKARSRSGQARRWGRRGLSAPCCRGQDGGGLDAGIRAVLDEVIAQMSNWSEISDLSCFNRADAGSWVTLPEDCFTVLQAALDRWRATAAAPTIPAPARWSISGASARLAAAHRASADDVARARQHCGWQRIEIDASAASRAPAGRTVARFLRDRQGFAVDAVSRYLLAQGVPHHLVEIGGELRGQGLKPDGMPWWVELESPAPMADRTRARWSRCWACRWPRRATIAATSNTMAGATRIRSIHAPATRPRMRWRRSRCFIANA